MDLKWSRISLNGDETHDDGGEPLSSSALVAEAIIELGNVHIELRSNNGIKVMARKRFSVSGGTRKLHGFFLRLETETDECFNYFIVDKCRIFIAPLKKKLVEIKPGVTAMKQIILKKGRPCEIDFNESYITKIKLRNS